MEKLREEIIGVTQDLFSKYREDRVPRLAASIAYFGAFALAPLIILVTMIAGLFVGEDSAETGIVNIISEVAGDELGSMVNTMLANVMEADTSVFILLTIVSMFFIGAVGAFLQLQDALNTIWNVTPKSDKLKRTVVQRIITFVIVVVAGITLIVSIMLSTFVTNFGVLFGDLGFIPFTLSRTLVFLLGFGLVTLLFAIIFKIVPDIQISWRAIWLGALVTAMLFTVANLIIAANIDRANFSSVYGTAGSLIILLLWVYYSAQVLFIGAEITQVYTERYGTEVEPEDFAVPVERVEGSNPSGEGSGTEAARS
jgi:membrane protein